MPTPHDAQADAVLRLLRGEVPAPPAADDQADASLRLFQCGGYVHDQWSRSGQFPSLPPAWAQAMGRAHRKTLLDNLAAVAELQNIGSLLAAEGVPFILLKGAAYLVDLYADPGARCMADLDLLIRREDVGRMARRLMREGYRGELGAHYPEARRFEMWRPGAAPCRFEFHWSLGLPRRTGVDQAAIWERSRPALLEKVGCRTLAPEDALLYHAIHAADHYFGPSLKWTIDLREMLRTWRPDLKIVLERSATWRCRSALHLALCHVEKLFPGEVPPDLLAGTRPGRLRGVLQRLFLSGDSLALLAVTHESRARLPLRCLMIDRPLDAALLTLRVLARPLTRPLLASLGTESPPWEWSD